MDLRIILLILLSIIMIVLQFFLSRKNEWLGLVLPLISFIVATLLYGGVGNPLRFIYRLEINRFIIVYIPTLILLGIYIHFKPKAKNVIS